MSDSPTVWTLASISGHGIYSLECLGGGLIIPFKYHHSNFLSVHQGGMHQNSRMRLYASYLQLDNAKCTVLRHSLLKTTLKPRRIGVDRIVQCFTSPPTQYRLYGRRFLQVKRPNQQYQSTEGTYSTQTNQTYNKQIYKHITHRFRHIARYSCKFVITITMLVVVTELGNFTQIWPLCQWPHILVKNLYMIKYII